MKLPVPTLFNKKEKTEYFLSLLLRDEKASAVILEELQGKIHIIGKHEEYFSTSVEDVSIEEMLDVLDKTISKAEEALPPNIETEKTVFGVKENWVEDKKIKKDYLAKLKKVSDELHLQPIGFLVISEAIAHLIQEEEGAPFTGIVTEVGRKNVTLTLFRANKPLETHSGVIEESVPKAVDTALKHFTSSDILPSRVIIFDGKRADELSQEFIAHQWSRSLPFLHVPQVAVLPSNFDARAVVFGAAEQMGFEILGSIVDKTAHEIQPLPQVAGTKHPKKSEEEKEALPEEKEDESDKESEKDDEEDSFPKEGDNFGFVMEKDIAESKIAKDGEKDDREDTDEEEGKGKAHDFASAHEAQAHHKQDLEPATDSRGDERENRDENKTSPLSGIAAGFGGVMAGLGGVFSRMPNIIGAIRGGNKLLLIPPVILLLLVGLFLFYIFQTKATVHLSLQPKMVDEEESVVFEVDGDNDFSENVIKAKRVATTLSGSSTTAASGKKEVGEKAKGSVTLFNSSEGKKTLPEGTIIKSSNDLEFTLDKEVSIASASGDIFSGIKSGTAKGDVTARKIGTEFNLPSNTKFTVEGTSTVAAKNDSAFSGGTKKNVTVVAKKDQEKLASELPKTLEGKAKEELEKKLGSGEVLVSGFTDRKLAKAQYSKKVDEEAKDIKLAADVTFEAISYNKSDLEEYAQTILKDRASSDQALAKDKVEAEVRDLKINKNTIQAKLLISAGLLPKLDMKKITQEVTGKSFDEANTYLSNLPQVSDAEIVLSPNIPFLPKLLPRRESNITVVIEDQ